MGPPLSLRASVYDILEVAPPDNRVSHGVQRLTILLVFLNTMALILSFIDVFKPYQIYVFWLVETLSTAFFMVEYFLRLWSAPASQHYRGRLRFALRFLLLIDLAAILPFVVALCMPSRDVTLYFLRLGWGIRHLKLLRYVRPWPLVKTSRDDLLLDAEERLEQVCQQVAQAREMDLARVHRSIDAVSRQCYAASMRQRERQRREPQPLSPPTGRLDAASSPFLPLLEQLADDLTDSAHMAEIGALISAAYQQSASVFDAAPRRAMVDVALDGEGRVGQKLVPLRRIGQQHFTPMASCLAEAIGTRQPLYVAEVQREMSRLRTAMVAALEQDGSQEGEISLNRTINQLRDVDVPVRLAWDNILLQLEEQQQQRSQWVNTDIERYGSLSFYLGGLWRWLRSRLRAIRRLSRLAVRLWATLQRLHRDSLAFISRTLVPVLQRLGVLKTPTRELLRVLDEARLDSVLERGLPADYLRYFAFPGLKDEELFIGFDEELVHINAAIERWQDQRESSFIVYGHRGVGKSTLLHMAQQRLFANHPVTYDTITQKVTTTAALVEHLAELLGCPDADSVEALADDLLVRPPRAILLEDCHYLFFRNVGGLEAIRHLFWLIAKTNHHVLWGVSLDQCGYDFLNQILPLNDLCHIQIGMQERSPEELRRLIMMRHNRSGISLYYVHDKRNAKAVRRHVKALRKQRRSGRDNLQEALELAFFDGLARACAGNITVALFYWLRALQVQDADRYDVQPFAELNLSLIWEFSQGQAFILVAILQHGQLTPEELADILDTDKIETRLELEILANHNILQHDPHLDTFEVNPVVLKTICAMLQARRLLY